jgi:CheY-like chemotaxis protein
MPETILVVDDDTSIVNLLRENLELEGYRVHVGYDGQAAVQLGRSVKPQLIILDVNMPLIGGLMALGHLRELPETKNIPVLFLTGEASSNVFPQLESEPRVAHVKKPIDLEDLNSLVRAMLDKYPTEISES